MMTGDLIGRPCLRCGLTPHPRPPLPQGERGDTFDCRSLNTVYPSPGPWSPLNPPAQRGADFRCNGEGELSVAGGKAFCVGRGWAARVSTCIWDLTGDLAGRPYNSQR